MPDDYQPLDRRRRHEYRPMTTERRLGLPEDRKVHAFVMKDVLSMRRTTDGYRLHMKSGEIRLIPDAEMTALAQQSYLPQIAAVKLDQPARPVEDDRDGAVPSRDAPGG